MSLCLAVRTQRPTERLSQFTRWNPITRLTFVVMTVIGGLTLKEGCQRTWLLRLSVQGVRTNLTAMGLEAPTHHPHHHPSISALTMLPKAIFFMRPGHCLKKNFLVLSFQNAVSSEAGTTAATLAMNSERVNATGTQVLIYSAQLDLMQSCEAMLTYVCPKVKLGRNLLGTITPP